MLRVSALPRSALTLPNGGSFWLLVRVVVCQVSGDAFASPKLHAAILEEMKRVATEAKVGFGGWQEEVSGVSTSCALILAWIWIACVASCMGSSARVQ